MLLLLFACSEPGPRPITVSDASDAESGELWAPEGATDEDLAESLSEAWNGGECGLQGGGEGELTTGWCVRLSPEGNESIPGGSDAAGPPPPCGFYNLLGATVLSGTPSDPVLLYCDSDQEGGIRVARYDEGASAVDAEILAPENCWMSGITGAMIPTDGGWLAWWVGNAGTYATGAGVIGVRLDEAGVPMSPAADLSVKAEHLVAVAGESPMLLGVDWDGTLWGSSVNTLDASEVGFPLTLGTGVATLGAAATESGIGLASCLSGGGLSVQWLTSVGAVVSTLSFPETACGYATRPGVAASGDALAVTWTDEEGRGTLALLSAEAEVIAEIDLGELVVSPAISAADSGWWVLSGDGMLSHYDRAGSLTGAWRHPHFPEDDAGVMGLALQEDGAQFSTLLWQRELEFIGDHAYTYEYLELSVGWLPSR